MRLTPFVTVLVVGTLVATGAPAGVIQGTLWMGPRPQRPGAVPDAKHQRGVADAVVYVEAVPDRAERDLTTTRFLLWRRPRPSRPLTVVQRGRFEPRVAAVASGSAIAFVNLDRVYHNVFSVASARRFDLGKYAPGARDTVRFDRAGVVNLHCDIHPDELGYVVVTPNHAFARPDSLGRYRLPRLPAGTYTVRVFLPRHTDVVRTVELPKRGDVTLDLGE